VLDSAAVVIEAGGHAGQLTKLLATLTPNGRILTFEPGSYAFGILEQVVCRRTGGRAKAFQAALGSREEIVELRIPLKESGSVRFGLSHIVRQAESAITGAQMASECVRRTTVDEIVAVEGLERLDLLKANIEGGELQMLKGSIHALERFQPTLFLEVNDAHLKRADDSAAELWSFVKEFDYRGFLFDTAAVQFLPAPPLATGDLWFMPRGRIS
jgi:FkbM family methyltransferase